MLSSKPEKTVFLRRESVLSTLALAVPLPTTRPQPLVQPPTSVFLPKHKARIAYVPKRRAVIRPRMPQDEAHPRVAKILGPGGQCVTVPQAAGFAVHAGAARNWPSAAKKLGYTVNKNPQAGSVIVTAESSYGSASGHVALVKKVEGNYVYVVESNYLGRTKTEGWIPTANAVAFIHPTR